jgi:hypothetical protein
VVDPASNWPLFAEKVFYPVQYAGEESSKNVT